MKKRLRKKLMKKKLHNWFSGNYDNIRTVGSMVFFKMPPSGYTYSEESKFSVTLLGKPYELDLKELEIKTAPGVTLEAVNASHKKD